MTLLSCPPISRSVGRRCGDDKASPKPTRMPADDATSMLDCYLIRLLQSYASTRLAKLGLMRTICKGRNSEMHACAAGPQQQCRAQTCLAATCSALKAAKALSAQ